MSAGKRFKFAGSLIQVITAFDTDSPPQAITGITQADPAVFASTSHGRAVGDIVRVQNVVGMDEVNEQVYVVASVPDANHLTFDGLDSSGYGAYVSGGELQLATLSNMCELTNYNRQGGTSPEIPASTVCSTAAEFEVGLPDFGTTQLSYNFAPQTAVQGALHDAYIAGEITAVKITLPKNGGVMVQTGFVQQETETAGVGGLWTATTTLRNTGNRVDIDI